MVGTAAVKLKDLALPSPEKVNVRRREQPSARARVRAREWLAVTHRCVAIVRACVQASTLVAIRHDGKDVHDGVRTSSVRIQAQEIMQGNAGRACNLRVAPA